MNPRPSAAPLAAALLAAALLAAAPLAGCATAPAWTDEERAALGELRLVEGLAPPDPSNRYAASEDAARLGQRFFFDTRFSANGRVSCATCHLPERGFQDGTPLGHGVGTTTRRTMPVAGMDAAPFLFWDGRKDSLWAQALGPLESPVEHGGDRAQYAHLVAERYGEDYARVFGALPDLSDVPAHASPVGSQEARAAWAALPPAQQDAVNRVFANVGKALAAYERRLQPGPSRFDRYVDAVLAGDGVAAREALSRDEEAGLRLFLGKAQCTRCHNGPLLTNHDFANTGVPAAAGLPEDTGRLAGAAQVREDPFNCLGPYSDAAPARCGELRALHVDGHALRQFKVPSLRSVAERAPYMHAGQLATLEDVVAHYDAAPRAPAGRSELAPLGLSARERAQLALFLRTLSAPLASAPHWLRAPTP
jgi:cytochrome c peroxidase